MDSQKLQSLLQGVQNQQVSIEDALSQLSRFPFDDLDYARLDTHRALRQGVPEVVFCQGKSIAQVIGIFSRLWEHHDRILGTRVTPEMAQDVQKTLADAQYDPTSRLLWLSRQDLPQKPNDAPYVMVVSGGTSDMPVAEEAAQTAAFFGSRVERAYDVGVAGLHRLLRELEPLSQADVVISVAGMEGALTSVVGGLVACPVIGVPTSVGYGAHFEGVAPLLSMLNSCATGVTVVNIDNGFGAGVYAHRILSRLEQAGSE